MVGVFNIRGEGYEDGLEEDVDVCRDMFSGRAEVGNNGVARIVRFVDFGKEVQGLMRRDKSSLDRPCRGPAVARKLDRSVLKVQVGSWDRGW